VALRRRAVDTDQIIPAEFCKRVTKSGYADGLFARWRIEPDFALAQPERAGASILVAAEDFGTGSSREHAVWALRDGGFAAVISARFGDIFRRNALKNGLLAVSLPAGTVDTLMDMVDADPLLPVTVDLEARQVRATDLLAGFDVDERARWLLLNGLDDIEVTLRQEADITAYERGREAWLPALRERPARVR
jgi:3-isopropylmalate/(R)-2-methylmalate dehydratase small subunit